MSAWSDDELTRVGGAEELELSSRRADGSLRRFIPIWVVRAGDGIYVRSAYGYENAWFQRALQAKSGRVRAGGSERDVSFEPPGLEIAGAVSDAYHAKYDHYGAKMVGTVVSPEAVRLTLRVVPA